VKSKTDVSNFDKIFTSEAPRVTPPDDGGDGGAATAGDTFTGFEEGTGAANP
jgi:hypothetical protein